MDNKAGLILVFALGTLVGYKWPAIKAYSIAANQKLKASTAKGYLAVKGKVVSISSNIKSGSEGAVKKVKKTAVEVKA